MRKLLQLMTVSMLTGVAVASDRLSILDFAAPGTKVDRTGSVDASIALSNAILAANEKLKSGEPVCIYIPPGTYRIKVPPPPFVGAGCVVGDGPSQSTLLLDPQFKGDLFAWSESWIMTTPGPMVVGLKIRGSKSTTAIQNAFVFYDRNDQVFMDNVDVWNLNGRALLSGITKNATRAYMRESHLRSLRFFEDGAPGIPVVEFNSQGSGATDATNEVRLSQVDIYGARGPSFVVRNSGDGVVRDITVEALRIEGLEGGTTTADLITIGDPTVRGGVCCIAFTNLELIDPYPGYAAFRMTAPQGVAAPYQISAQGSIGGGAARGQGLRIDAGRGSFFRFSTIHTNDTNVVIGRDVSQILLDGGGEEGTWTYEIEPSSLHALRVPIYKSDFASPQKSR